MGGEPYWYFVPYQPNIQAALDALRAREFKAGRYNPVMPFQRFPVDADSPAPGNKHRKIDVSSAHASHEKYGVTTCGNEYYPHHVRKT